MCLTRKHIADHALQHGVVRLQNDNREYSIILPLTHFLHEPWMVIIQNNLIVFDTSRCDIGHTGITLNVCVLPLSVFTGTSNGGTT